MAAMRNVHDWNSRCIWAATSDSRVLDFEHSGELIHLVKGGEPLDIHKGVMEFP